MVYWGVPTCFFTLPVFLFEFLATFVGCHAFVNTKYWETGSNLWSLCYCLFFVKGIICAHVQLWQNSTLVKLISDVSPLALQYT